MSAGSAAQAPSTPPPSRGVSAVRWAVGGLGVVVGVYGAYLFLSRQTMERQLVSAAKYLVGGVVFNDLLVALVALAVGFVVVRFLPYAVRAPIVVGGFVLGSITLLAIPVLLSYGRKPDNPTLLDRDFTGGWWVFAGVVVVCTVVACVVRVRRGVTAPAAPSVTPRPDPVPGQTAD